VQSEEIGSWGAESVTEEFEILDLRLTLGYPLCYPGRNTSPCDDEPIGNLVLLPCDLVRYIFLFRSIIPLQFSRTKALSTMS
jgi:hypothetical protein